MCQKLLIILYKSHLCYFEETQPLKISLMYGLNNVIFNHTRLAGGRCFHEITLCAQICS